VDERIKKLAEILVNHCIKIKKGQTIRVNCGIESSPLALQVCEILLKKKVFPKLNMVMPGYSYLYFKHVTDEMLRKYPKIADYEIRNSHGVIHIGSEYNTREFSNIDPKKFSMRSKVLEPLKKFSVKQDNWALCEFPTNALAQEAGMSLNEYEDFVYGACLLDWKKQRAKQKKIKKLIMKGKQVRIVGKETDITFSIKGKKVISSWGRNNMPDGEVFTEPVTKSVNGYILFDYPVVRGGNEVDGVRLMFKEGKAVEISAEKNERFLQAMLNTDKGASSVGEFGIGMNPMIKKFTKKILFDEKMIGTIHLALGSSFPFTGGENKSAIHWDMIKDLRKGGKIIIDGKIVQRNGKWLI
ncbi:aminopeptidase, partial [Nanoarchaeota archaeon]